MPKIDQQEIDRLVKDAEWKGQTVATITTIAEQAVIAREAAIKLQEEVNDHNKKIAILVADLEKMNQALERMSERITAVIKQEGAKKLSGKDRAVIYGSLITAISAVVIEIIRCFGH